MRPLQWFLAILSGALLVLSFPPFSLWPLAWVALVPLYVAVSRCDGAKAAANLGAVTGLVFYVPSLFWFYGIFGVLAAAFWCLFSLWVAIHAALVWRFGRGRNGAGKPLVRVLAAGILWAGVEYFRSEVWWLRNSWLALGYSQVPNLPILQLCSLVGVYGLSALIVSVNAALSLLPRHRRPAIACLLLALAASVWGWARARTHAVDDGKPVRVALIQNESFNADVLAGLSLGRDARKAELVVWPEYAFLIQKGQEERYRKLLAGKLSRAKAVAVVGAAMFYDDRNGKERGENFVWVLSREGRILGRYDKMHPIQHMETLLTPNRSPRPVMTPVGMLGIQICYDLDYENGTRAMVRQGAGLLAVPNLDAIEWGERQHLMHSAMSPVRAVESGLWVARAASSGVSQLIDPSGRIMAFLPVGISGVAAGTAYLRHASTTYVSFGWLAGPACLLATLVAIVRALVRRKRGPAKGKPGKSRRGRSPRTGARRS